MSKALDQDPHGTSVFQERELEVAIGRQVRHLRRKKGRKIAQFAAEMNISEGMVSKIENGQVSPSLSMLQRLAGALSVPLTALFQGYEEDRPAVHVRAGEGVEADRAGTRAGHHYTLLGLLSAQSSAVVVEPYLITLTEESDVFPLFQHSGLEFIYMLEGEVDYRHGDQIYPLKPGDTLFFDADAPHGPERLVNLPARYISVISYPQTN